jgi:SAM-dependent methyltransferase
MVEIITKGDLMADQAVYTHGHHDSVLRSHRWRTLDNSAAYLRDRLWPGATVLDVGCGPGTITAEMAEKVAPGRVIGIDAAESVLVEARSIAGERGLENLHFQQADIYALPFDDDTFDVVHAHQVLQHIADPVAGLREMRRVCRPGGIVAARDADYGAMVWFPEVPRLDDWNDLYRDVARANHGTPDGGRYLLSWAQAAGFEKIESSASAWCFATPQDRAWWGDLWAVRTVASSYADRALDAGLATRADLEAIAAAWREWIEQPDGWFSVLHGEILCTA